MIIERIPFSKVSQFSKKDVAYDSNDQALRPFFNYEANIASFEKVIKAKQQQSIDRETLYQALKNQYADLAQDDRIDQQIEALRKDNGFTIITAHQPSLFTGPLYYIYKIMSTINLTEQLNEAYPSQHFVPLFITGGEDHDFEEVNHMELFNKKLVWESGEKGSVGAMKTSTVQPVLAELKSIVGESENAIQLMDILEKAFEKNERYGDATVEMVHELFKTYGLLVLNMNSSILKGAFATIVKEEIFNQPSKFLVEKAQKALEVAGFKAQAFPRTINFFYLGDQFRERIVYEDSKYRVLNQNIEFSKEELEKEIDNYPERFSSNVVMRPLFQEAILPNLAYIGGGGELAYWLERKEQFAHFKIPFPMLIRRNSVLWIDKAAAKRMSKSNLGTMDLLLEEESLVKHFVHQQSTETLDLNAEIKVINEAFEGIKVKALALDPGLEKKVAAEQAKQMNVLKGLESRLIKSAKQKHETGVNQVRNIYQKLFPNGSLQERKHNFIPFYLQHGKAYFDILKEALDPMTKGLVVITEDK